MEEKNMRELSMDEMNMISGGAGELKLLLELIYADGRANELKTLLKTQGKAVAAAKCSEYYPQYCGWAAAVVTML